jgi:hypothetical protein
VDWMCIKFAHGRAQHFSSKGWRKDHSEAEGVDGEIILKQIIGKQD